MSAVYFDVKDLDNQLLKSYQISLSEAIYSLRLMVYVHQCADTTLTRKNSAKVRQPVSQSR